jgi:hypothetical protein
VKEFAQPGFWLISKYHHSTPAAAHHWFITIEKKWSTLYLSRAYCGRMHRGGPVKRTPISLCLLNF